MRERRQLLSQLLIEGAIMLFNQAMIFHATLFDIMMWDLFGKIIIRLKRMLSVGVNEWPIPRDNKNEIVDKKYEIKTHSLCASLRSS